MRAKSVREGAGKSARGRRAEHECRRGAPLHFLDRGGAQDTPPENSSQEEISRLSPGSGLPDGWGAGSKEREEGSHHARCGLPTRSIRSGSERPGGCF